MRCVFGLFLAVALGLAATQASAQQVYRTNTGPYGADFSGVELGPDFGFGFGDAAALSTSGGAFGAHLGYNFQANQIVGGVEGDILGGSISSGGAPFGYSQHFLSSLRAKGGYVFGDILAYGTLGVGWGTSRYSDPTGSGDATNKGVVYGVGAEYAITRNVSVRAELQRWDFGSQNYTLPGGTVGVSSATNMLKVGGSLHF